MLIVTALFDFAFIVESKLPIFPDWVKQAMKGSIRMTVGEQFCLDCEADGFPKPTIQFYKGNQLLDNRENFEITNTSLCKRHAEFSDNGIYRCEAQNPVGCQSLKIHVVVNKDPPGTTYNEVALVLAVRMCMNRGSSTRWPHILNWKCSFMCGRQLTTYLALTRMSHNLIIKFASKNFMVNKQLKVVITFAFFIIVYFYRFCWS